MQGRKESSVTKCTFRGSKETLKDTWIRKKKGTWNYWEKVLASTLKEKRKHSIINREISRERNKFRTRPTDKYLEQMQPISI